MKRSPLKRDPERVREFVERGRRRSNTATSSRPVSACSRAQREAVKGLLCLGCGREEGSGWLIDPAHVWPRGRGGDCGSRFDVFPLCRSAFDGSGCHRSFDDGDGLDLLSVMLADWPRWWLTFVHALRHADGPVQLLERLAGRRIQWEERS